MLLLSVLGFLFGSLRAGIVPLVLLFVYYCLNVCYSLCYFHNPKANLLSGVAAYVQLTGYGCGFIEAWWKRCVMGKSEFAAYEKNFYK